MKILHPLLLLLALVTSALAADKDKEGDAKKPGDDPVFRKPFTLRLHIDRENLYEQEIDKVPYVHKDVVYLFKGDEFGLALDIKDNAILSVQHQPDLKKADVTLKFTQDVKPDGTSMMLLHLHNNTRHTVSMDALMTLPGKKGVAKTTVLPLQPSLSGYESWPHPIVQLVLRNIQIAK